MPTVTSMKDPPRGLYHRKDVPASGAIPHISGWVATPGWNQLLATRDGTINRTFLDSQIATANADASLSKNGDLGIKVRVGVDGGTDHPQYVRDLCGLVTMYHCVEGDKADWLDGFDIVRWWEPIYATLYDEFIEKCAAEWDTDSAIRDWVISGGRTFYMEIFIRQQACKWPANHATMPSWPQNAKPLLDAGYTREKDIAAHKAFMASHAKWFQYTRSSVAITPLQWFKHKTPTPPPPESPYIASNDGVTATSWTVLAMDHMVDTMGARAIIGNNAYTDPLKAPTQLYTEIEDTSRTVCRYYQTENTNKVELINVSTRPTVVNMVELPGNYPYKSNLDTRALRDDELDAWDTRLRGNSFPSGVSSAPAAPTITATAAGSTQINITVTPPTDKTGIGQYRIYEGSTLVATVFPANLTVPITGLVANSTHTYTAKSYNGVESVASPSAAATTAAAPSPADLVEPTRPGRPVGTITPAFKVDLAWEASEDDRTGVRRYTVRRNGAVIGEAASTAWRDTGVARGQTYTYTVTPYDGAAPPNQGQESLAATVTVPAEAVAAMEWLGVGELEMVFDPT